MTIITDSQHVIGVLSKHWKPRHNQTLIPKVKALLSKHIITFEKVEYHSDTDTTLSERADELTRKAAQS